MPEQQRLYLRLRHRVQVRPKQQVVLSDIAQLVYDMPQDEGLEQLVIHHVTPQDEHLIVIDVMQVIRLLQAKYPAVDVEVVGPNQVILEIAQPERSPRFLLVLFVWVLLFVGSGLTIMNFHEDVSMQEVHRRLFTMVTGEEEAYPLWLQIPYSIGIGAGMIIFFNHIFKKRLNEEPSPLEVEMFNYQQNIDQYVAMHENKEVEKKLDDGS